MYPHERSLVKRLAGKPFALLGVNCDFDRDELKTTIKEQKIRWRSWWDGGKVGGPIQEKYQVEIRPTIYVLDAGGVIRMKGQKDIDLEELDGVINRLVKDAEQK